MGVLFFSEIYQQARELFDLYAAGKVKPRISARFPLEQGAEALQLLEARKSTGKVLVTMQ